MKIKTALLLIACIVLSAPAVNAQGKLQAQLKKHITYLASDTLHGRMTGTNDEHRAAEYIIQQFKLAGINNAGGNFDEKKYFEPFEFNPTVDSVKIHVAGSNVVAFINNHAATTVVIGAHYDHLGWGDPKYSTYRGAPAVHHGADDNASGTAALIEMAGMIKKANLKGNNYVFIAFSGEELGLYGSKWFTEHPTFDLTKASYMFNFDMIGRLDSTSHTLTVNGVGTSPVWKDVVNKFPTPLHIKTTESGIGPSDQTSFYLKDIPVLFFFTGQHKDYHKPSDIESKINYAGEEDVIDYSMTLVKELDNKGKLPFTKTKTDSTTETPKFKVTLGVMPDYTYDGEGMRIDGVTDGKPASKAGILAGDVVIQLGDIKVTEMMSYMKGLAQFNKGDKTIVKLKRGKEVIEKEVTW